jgi:flavorubredoxin
LDADLERITPLKDLNIAMKGIKAVLGLKSDIKTCKIDIKDVDYLVIATPVWAGHSTPYVNKFISLLSGCSGKCFSVLVEMSGSGGDGTIEQVRKSLEKKGMQFVSSAITVEEEVGSGNYKDTVSKLADSIKEHIKSCE